MMTIYNQILELMARVDDTLAAARQGLNDLLDPGKKRRMTGLRNVLVFGRSVTFVLQNLRSIIPDEFAEWYAPHQIALRADPLMRYFVLARNELEKQGKLSVSTHTVIRSFSFNDTSRFGPAPRGATTFFIGDRLGGTGWEVPMPGGAVEKYYVDLPPDIGEVQQVFSNLPLDDFSDLEGQSIEILCVEYLNRIGAIVADANRHFVHKN